MITAITYKQLNRLRTRLYLEGKEFGYDFASFISKDSIIDEHVGWGENCVILNNNNLQYKVQIGNNVIIWSGNHIGHSTEIMDNCFISSGITIAGNCKIGRSCFIGIGANIIDGISIGEDCIIAAGACITEDTEPKTVYAGVPAKPIRRITEKDLTNNINKG
jgi:sugar O-acyltransferase (sialic acid O-acetyltransferase NeuD family)